MPAEGKYWNPTLEKFTAEQWDAKVKEIADAGLRYPRIVGCGHFTIKSFYPTSLLPKHEMGCEDPLEVGTYCQPINMASAFFVSNGFFGEWRNPAMLMKDPEVNKLRVKAMNEIAEKYGHHKSFYGWVLSE